MCLVSVWGTVNNFVFLNFLRLDSLTTDLDLLISAIFPCIFQFENKIYIIICHKE